MRDRIEMEEVFENEELFAAELEAERAERARKFASRDVLVHPETPPAGRLELII